MTTLRYDEQTMPIPKSTLRALTELTGQVELPPAILMTLKDAIKYRLAKIRTSIKSYEEKHKMNFEEFEARGQNGDLESSSSYQVEQDYFEWDSLIARKKKLKEILLWLT